MYRDTWHDESNNKKGMKRRKRNLLIGNSITDPVFLFNGSGLY
jgi:hypothetical protein